MSANQTSLGVQGFKALVEASSAAIAISNQNSLGDQGFRALVEASSTAIAVSSLADGKFVDANQSFLVLHGYTREEVIGHTSTELGLWCHPEERDHLLALLADQGAVPNFAHEYRCKDGRIGRALVSATIIRLDDEPHVMGFLTDISELDESQQALIEGELDYYKTFDELRNGVAFCRMLFEDGCPVDFVYLKVNKAFERQTGLRNVVGRRVSDVIPGVREGNPRLFEIYGRVALTGRTESFEIYIDELKSWFAITVVSPRREHFIAIFDVTTEFKRTELEAKASKLKLETALEATADAVFISDAEGRLVEFNAAFATFHRFRNKSECSGALREYPAFLEVFTADGGPAPPEQWAVSRALRGETATDQEYRLKRRDTGETWIGSFSLAPIRDPDGSIAGAVVTARDITERKRAEDDLRISATAFNTQEGIFVTDSDGVIVRVNEAFMRITGYEETDVIGNNPALLKSGHHDRSFYEHMWQMLIAEGFWQGEIWNRRKDGRLFPCWEMISAVRGAGGGISNFVATFFDISEIKETEQHIHHLAHFDVLTDLPNRRMLQDRIGQAQGMSDRTGSLCAVLFMDMDNFKALNDTRGHGAGDKLLIEAAQRIRANVRVGDTVGRFGGDEFLVLLEALGTDARDAALEAECVGEKLRAALQVPYDVGADVFHCGVSVGVALFRGREESVETVLQHADLAMYQAKGAGRNALRFFDPAMQASLDARTALDADLRLALEHDQFLLHYQPQVQADGAIVGAEALVRWAHPSRGIVAPAEFISRAEETGAIVAIGCRILESACSQLAAWASLPLMRELRLAVNVSPRQFRQAEFVDEVLRTLARSGADPSRLELELTESIVLEDVEDAFKKMRALKANGISFSLDDFGTGSSSLSYLSRLPLDQLKIDQSFVAKLPHSRADAIIVQTIISMAASLGLDVIAEGVELAEQRAFLMAHGCRQYQGYLLARPMPATDLQVFVAESPGKP